VFISYDNVKIRECCFLLNPSYIDSLFTVSEVKLIRSIIADLRSAPKLIDAPIKTLPDPRKPLIYIYRDSFKITCEIISSYVSPDASQIERLKINSILNIDLQKDSDKNKEQN